MLNCTFLIALYAVIEHDRYKLVLEKRIFGKVLIVHMDLSCLKSYRNGKRIIIPVSYIYIKFFFLFFFCAISNKCLYLWT